MATRCTCGSAEARAQADARSGRRAADGAGAAAGPQSDRDLRLRGRRHVAEGSLIVDLWVLEGKNGNGQWKIRKVIEIPRSRLLQQLPPLLKGFGAVSPLVTDINLSVDDRFLYVSCWGTGELRQDDVSDPFNPALTGTVEIGGIVRAPRTPGSQTNR